MDLLRDFLGACSFLIFAASFERAALRRFSAAGSGRTLMRTGAAALLMLAFLPAFSVARAYSLRADAFPRLFDFEGAWESHFIQLRGTEWALMPPPGLRERASKNRAARVTYPSGRASSFSLEEPYPDWTGYQTLRFEVYSNLDREVILIFRIRDETGENRYRDLFERELSIRPGVNPISIALDEVKSAPEKREMDMSSIRKVILAARNPKVSFSVFLDAFRLEKP